MYPTVKVENLSKQYRLGQVGTGTLSHDLNRMWARMRGRPDPYATIGLRNDRAVAGGDDSTDYVWALKDVNFSIGQGEIVGIIGKNGAGKSTLLKLLSRVTAPTTGLIELRGRVASLLEVGTGFHPELTGRENIFLNGAILGMTRAEIRTRFDEIVDFSGCAKYVDTPVKRYSSGMYVRLAFAVAAHLDPEILIVDEVLAVGDAEFQNRCIGKMKDVARNSGRTVLFVSHNMGSILSLCDRGILIEQGQVTRTGPAASIVDHYLSRHDAMGCHSVAVAPLPLPDIPLRITKAELLRNNQPNVAAAYDVYDTISVELSIEVGERASGYGLFIRIRDRDRMIGGSWDVTEHPELLSGRKPGVSMVRAAFPSPLLKEGRYAVDLLVTHFGHGDIQIMENALMFDVMLISRNPKTSYTTKDRDGVVALQIDWENVSIA